MPRWPRMLLWAISLLLCVSFCILWRRSYAGSDYLVRVKPTDDDPVNFVENHTLSVTWTRGSIRLGAGRNTAYPKSPQRTPTPHPAIWRYGRQGVGHVGWDDLPVRSIWNRLGFHTYERSFFSSFADSDEKGIAIPAWLPVALLAIPVVVLPGKWVRTHRRLRDGLCPTCGYDLRASPERCPECGGGVGGLGEASIAGRTKKDH